MLVYLPIFILPLCCCWRPYCLLWSSIEAVLLAHLRGMNSSEFIPRMTLTFSVYFLENLSVVSWFCVAIVPCAFRSRVDTACHQASLWRVINDGLGRGGDGAPVAEPGLSAEAFADYFDR